MSSIKTRIAKAATALALTAGPLVAAGVSPAGAAPVDCGRLERWIAADIVRADSWMREGVNSGYLGDSPGAVSAFGNAQFLFMRISNMTETYNANC